MKTLKNFLEENDACSSGYSFAKDLTLEQFLNTCPRGDWILWLFKKMNPDSLRELTLAKGHCANTVRDKMTDERSMRAVDVAIAFGEGRATRKELDSAAATAYDAAADAADAAYAAADAVDVAIAFGEGRATRKELDSASSAAYAAADAAYAAYAAAAAAYDAADDAAAAKEENRIATADICRQYLPLEIWNQTKI